LKRKDKTRQERSANRRRVRGGAPIVVGPSKPAVVDPKVESRDDADEIAALYVRMLVFVHASLRSNSVSQVSPQTSLPPPMQTLSSLKPFS
jgi:hypothetical protein